MHISQVLQFEIAGGVVLYRARRARFDRHMRETKQQAGGDTVRSIRHAKHVSSTDYDLDWRERHALSHQFGEQREKEDGVAL
jgi:hypothetical protein